MLALAVCTKVFPLLVLGVLLLTSLRKGLRHGLELLGISTAVALAVNLPFTLLARENWLWFFEYSRVREIEPSLYLLAGVDPRAFAPSANLISAAATLGAAAALAAVELRTRRLDPLPAACGLVCIFFAANKVFSPQYWLWVVALIALAGAPAWLATAVSALSLADFVVSFSFLHLQSDRVWPQVNWFAHSVFWPMVALRYAALLSCAIWSFSRCLRKIV